MREGFYTSGVTDLNTWHGNEMIWFANEKFSTKERKKKLERFFLTQSQLDLLWLEGNLIWKCYQVLWQSTVTLWFEWFVLTPEDETWR